MNKPESFILNSDYATLRNDGGPATLQVTIPGGIILGTGAAQTMTADLIIGQKNASIRATIASLKEGNTPYVCVLTTVTRTGFISGPTSVPYNVACYLSRIDSTTLRLALTVWNPYNENMITAFGDEVFTAVVNTFISPFQN